MFVDTDSWRKQIIGKPQGHCTREVIPVPHRRREGRRRWVTKGDGRKERRVNVREEGSLDDETARALSFLRHPQCLPPNGRGCKPILSGKRIGNRRHQPGRKITIKEHIYNRA